MRTLASAWWTDVRFMRARKTLFDTERELSQLDVQDFNNGQLSMATKKRGLCSSVHKWRFYPATNTRTCNESKRSKIRYRFRPESEGTAPWVAEVRAGITGRTFAPRWTTSSSSTSVSCAAMVSLDGRSTQAPFRGKLKDEVSQELVTRVLQPALFSGTSFDTEMRTQGRLLRTSRSSTRRVTSGAPARGSDVRSATKGWRRSIDLHCASSAGIASAFHMRARTNLSWTG